MSKNGKQSVDCRGVSMKAKITEKIHNHYMLSMCLLAVLINLFIEFLSRKSLLSLLKFVFLSPHIFLYNCAVIWLTLTVSFLVKRKLFAAALVSIVWLLAGDVYKRQDQKDALIVQRGNQLLNQAGCLLQLLKQPFISIL